MSEKMPLHTTVREWVEHRLIKPPSMPRGGWCTISVLHQDYITFVGSHDVPLSKQQFSAHLKAIPGIEFRKQKNAIMLIGLIIPTVWHGDAKGLPLFGKVSKSVKVKPSTRKAMGRIKGSRTEVYLYRGMLKSAGEAVDGPRGETLVGFADTADPADIIKAGRAIVAALRKNKSDS